MRTFIAIAAASAGFLAAIAASPEVRAESMAGSESSSMANTLNYTDAGYQSGSESITCSTSNAERQNSTEASYQAEEPITQRPMLNTDRRGITNAERPKSWGSANAWGGNAWGLATAWGNGTVQMPSGAESSSKAQLEAHPASYVPRVRMYDVSNYGSRIASRTVPNRKVIRSRSHSNAQYAYRAKSTKVTGVQM